MLLYRGLTSSRQKRDQDDDVHKNHAEERQPLDDSGEMSPGGFLRLHSGLRYVRVLFNRRAIVRCLGLLVVQDQEATGSVAQDERRRG